MSTSLSLPRSTTWIYTTQHYPRCSFCTIGIARYHVPTTRNEPVKVKHSSACGSIVCVARLYLLYCGVQCCDDALIETAKHGAIGAVCETLLAAPSLYVADVQRITGADSRPVSMLVAEIRSCSVQSSQEPLAIAS